jgi:hypothetical protein
MIKATTIEGLRKEKNKVKRNAKNREKKISSMFNVAKMEILVPDLIRDKNNNIDWSKAITHFSIAALPLVYKKLKEQNAESENEYIDLITPIINQFVQKFAETKL